MRKRAALVAVAAVAGLVGLVPGVAGAATVTVPGTAGPEGEGGTYGSWGGTGIVDSGVVSTGSVVVSATGTVDASTNTSFGQDVPPEGDGETVCEGDCLAPHMAAWSLVVKIGDGPWQQGATGPITLTGTGPVLLAVNDGWYGDNGGAFSVTVEAVSTVDEQLATLHDDSVGVGPGSSLANKAAAVAAAHDAGDDGAACVELAGYVNQLRALRGKKVPAATADDLLEQAAAIGDALGC